MRNRMINQSMVDSRSLSRVSIGAALLFTWLLMLVDDEGLMPLDPPLIHRRIFGARDDVTEADTASWLNELAAQDCVRFYAAEDEEWLAVTNFYFYQSINRPSSSKCPSPPWNHRPEEERSDGKKVKKRCGKLCAKDCENFDSLSTHGALTLKGKERKGREEELLKESSSFSSLVGGAGGGVKNPGARERLGLAGLLGILGGREEA